ncbi:MAG: DUF721 domain-containing protein, partial [Bryobacteraceae bacterium]
MERAGRVLGKLKHSSVPDEELARAAWPLAVGKRIAGRTVCTGLVRSRLVVEVEDAVWQRQLFALRGQILAKLEETTGRPVVSELEFRVAATRRPPGREERTAIPSAGQPANDEADAIEDRVLRKVY